MFFPPFQLFMLIICDCCLHFASQLYVNAGTRPENLLLSSQHWQCGCRQVAGIRFPVVSKDTNVKAFVHKCTAIPGALGFIGVLPKVLREAHYYTKKSAEKEKAPLPPTPRTTQQPKVNSFTKAREGGGTWEGTQERSQRALAQSGAQHVGFSRGGQTGLADTHLVQVQF